MWRPSHRWQNKVEMGPRDIGWKDMDWINLVQGVDKWQALVNTVVNVWIP